MKNRLKRLSEILRKTVRGLSDDYNPDDNEFENPEIEVIDDEFSDINEFPETAEAEHPNIEKIRKRHQLMEEEKRLKQFEESRNQDSFSETDISFGRGLWGMISDARKELAEALSRLGDEKYDQEILQADIEKIKNHISVLNAKRRAGEKHSIVNSPRDKSEDSEIKPVEEYDRAKDTEKNQQAMDEIQETLEMVKKEVTRSDDLEIDDVLILAETLYSKEQAKKDLNNMPIKELFKMVMNKYNELYPKLSVAELRMKLVQAKRRKDDEDDYYNELKEMSDKEKIESADYVQLYALNKFFDKLLKKNKPNKADIAIDDEDEAIDVEGIARKYNIKPRPQHGEVRRFTPEEIEEYQKKMVPASLKLSKREASGDNEEPVATYGDDWVSDADVDDAIENNPISRILSEDNQDSSWENVLYELNKLMEKFNTSDWNVDGENLGWRGISGKATIHATDAKELLREILPKTDCSFEIYDKKDHITIINSHHDRMGEVYNIYPAPEEELEEE